ncbi:MAG: FkbM family methyltransferase [Ginsengibacter sp.]
MKFFKNILLKVLGEKNFLFLTATAFQLLYKTGRLGKEYQDVYFLKQIIQPGDIVADIGAHLGYYTFELGRLTGSSGKVIAIEPVSKFNRIIQKMIVSKKINNIELFKVALGGNGEFVEIGIPYVDKQKKFGYARIKEMHEYLEYAETEKVPNVKGDELFKDLTQMDFIKCDVEGAEVPVFKSMLGTLEKHKPVLLCELADKNERIKMFEILQPYLYDAYLLKDKKLVKLDVYSDVRAVSHNHYFIPYSRVGELQHLIV